MVLGIQAELDPQHLLHKNLKGVDAKGVISADGSDDVVVRRAGRQFAAADVRRPEERLVQVWAAAMRTRVLAAGDQLVATAAAILREAEAHGARSLALPAIGCGVMGWTPSRASQLVLRAIGAHEPQSLESIDVALYDDAIFAAYVAAAAELATVEVEAADGTRTFRLAGAPT